MAELKGFTFTVQAQGNFVIHAKNVEEAKELAQSNIAINARRLPDSDEKDEKNAR